MAFSYPIIELIDPRQGRVITKRGKIIGYKFSTQQKAGNDVYEIIENYTLEKDGTIKVSYDVYKGKDKPKVESLPAEIVEMLDTQKLNIKFLPVFIKNNTAHSSKFPEKNIWGIRLCKLSIIISYFR